MRIQLLALAFLSLVSCSKKKILIVVSDDTEKSIETVNLIKSLDTSSAFKYEETSKSKLPSLFNAQTNQLIYHAVYYLKSTWSSDWSADVVGAYLQKGGNLMTCATDNSILNEFGLDVVKGTMLVGGDNPSAQWNPQHSFSTLSNNLVTISPKESAAFKLRNDAKTTSFNPLIQNALSLPPGSAICRDKKCISTNQSVSLLATLESRNGSRFLAVASNNLLNSLPSEAKKGIFSWLQGTKFTLKIASISHQLSTGDFVNRGKTDLDSTIYRVKDRITVRMCLIGDDNTRFVPQDPTDFQFELKMMNIQVRKSFDLVDGDGCLQARDIQLPPKSAVYTLQVNYNRPGWSQLSHSERLLVRPYRHDEFPRFLLVALPYYISWIGVLVASYLILMPTILRKSVD